MKQTTIFSDAEILREYGKDATVSGHFPFRSLEMLQRNWRKDTPIIRMEIDGSFSRSIEAADIEVEELKNDVVGGYRIGHSITERFRYPAVLISPTGTHLPIQKIFRLIMEQKVVNSPIGTRLQVTPTTLYVREFTVQVLGKKYVFEGKVPKEVLDADNPEEKNLLRKQAREWKKKGDKDYTPAILDLVGVHSLAELLTLEKMFPPKWFFKRICVNTTVATRESKKQCVDIWNTGAIRRGDE